MVHLLRLSTFLVFVGLGLAVSIVPSARRRLFVDLFLGYILVLNGFVVLAQTDAWPFSPYRMMSVDARDRRAALSMVAFRGLRADGSEWDVEPLAWSPLFPQAVMGWFEVRFPRATDDERREVGRFLFERAEEARRARGERRLIGNARLLGPLSAPDTNLSRPAPLASDLPFVGLRVYRVHWVPESLVRDPTSVRRVLMYEYRRP